MRGSNAGQGGEVPSNMRLRLPENMTSQAYHDLVATLGGLGVEIYRTRFRPVPAGDEVTASPPPKPAFRAESSNRSENTHPITHEDIKAFRQSTAAYSPKTISMKWRVLQKFLNNRDSRAEYLRRPFDEVNATVRQKVEARQGLPLRFCEQAPGESEQSLDAISLYDTLGLVRDNLQLVDQLGKTGFNFFAEFLATALDANEYPPLTPLDN